VTERLDDHLVAHFELLDARPYLVDDSAGLVALYGGKSHVAADALDRLVIGRAEPAGLDSDDHIAEVLRTRGGHVLEDEVIEIMQYCCEHGGLRGLTV